MSTKTLPRTRKAKPRPPRKLHRGDPLNTIEGHRIALCGYMSRTAHPRDHGVDPPPGYYVCYECERMVRSR